MKSLCIDGRYDFNIYYEQIKDSFVLLTDQ